jgi:hypothetical protein
MKLKRYFRRALSLPPHVVVRKTARLAQHSLKSFYLRQRDIRFSTYLKSSLKPIRKAPQKPTFPPSYQEGDTSEFGKLYSYFRPVPMALLISQAIQIAELTNHYLAHRFNLLGSGWIQINHGMHCRGLEGYQYNMGSQVQVDNNGNWLKGRINSANLTEAQRIWRLVDEDYVPIDWQLDFKSGYRWSETTWYLDIVYAHQASADVKVPWELARMQHLSQLAWAYALATEKQSGFLSPDRYVREFRNQILDFIATSPPRFGVNWRCPMNTGIRVANWLVAYDLLRAYGATFDAEFEAEFNRSVYQHGWHIIHHLEWFQELRSNHYFSNLIGLLFVAAYLPRTPEIDAWLAFAVQELVTEVACQFYPDGANFEASTSYHRFSAELVAYMTALILSFSDEKQAALKDYNHHLCKVGPGLKPPPQAFYPLPDSDRLTPFPAWYFERLEKMAEFTLHITKPNGHIPQIGDNDSGRAFKLQPAYHSMTVAEARIRYANLNGYFDLPDEAIYWDEDLLDHRHLVATINGFFGRDDFTAFTGKNWLETELVRNIIGNRRFPSYLKYGQSTSAVQARIGTEEDWKSLSIKRDLLPGKQHVLKIPIPGGNLRQRLELYAYPDFGLYLYRSKHFYLAVRCGSIGQNGNGGHAHNDQLSIELNVNGEDWITDPGTYLYTPLPEQRNRYRSVKAHSTPQLEGPEPGRLDLGLFCSGNEAKAVCLYFGHEGFVGKHDGYGEPVWRFVQIKDGELVIIDVAILPFARNLVKINLSPSYGVIMR